MRHPREYHQAHANTRKVRGKASEHLCLSCGKSAREWALRQEFLDQGLTWSSDPFAYDPLCRSCHVLHDFPEEHRKEMGKERGRKGGEARAAHMNSDPEFAAELAETMLDVQRAGGRARTEKLRTDPEFAEEHAQRSAAILEQLRQREEVDPEFHAYMQEGRSVGGKRGGATTGKIRRQCTDCGLVTSPGPMGKHLKVSGHAGWIVVTHE